VLQIPTADRAARRWVGAEAGARYGLPAENGERGLPMFKGHLHAAGPRVPSMLAHWWTDARKRGVLAVDAASRLRDHQRAIVHKVEPSL
jgi:hypothetical protein